MSLLLLTLEHGTELHVGPDDLGDAVDVGLPAAVDVGVVHIIPVGRLNRNRGWNGQCQF